MAGVRKAVQVQEAVAGGSGGALVWPALLRKLARTNPGYDQ